MNCWRSPRRSRTPTASSPSGELAARGFDCVLRPPSSPDQRGNRELGPWRRFGTPTGVAGSGTEEEYRIAYRTWEENNAMPLLFYFCQKPFMPRSLDEVDQIRQ